MSYKARVALGVVVLSWNCTGNATQNQLTTNLNVQQISTNNFLLSASNPESLYGIQTQPSIEYQFDDSRSSFGLSVRDSLERYNRSAFNGSFPQFRLNYKERIERGGWGLSLSGNQQSTRSTEFKDSGLLESKASRRDESSVRGNWNYQISEQNSLLFDLSAGIVNYKSNTYADLKNISTQFIEQYQWNEKLSVYVGATLSEYSSKYLSYFPIVPLLIEGNLLCPPDTRLINSAACYRLRPELGNANNKTTSEGMRAGVKYTYSEKVSVNLDLGSSSSETKQTITQKTIPVYFGSPIEKELLFGGENENFSDAKTTTASLDLNFSGEYWMWKISGSQQLLPSSAGTLRKSQTLGIDASFKQSEVTVWNFNAEVQDSSSLDREVLSNVNSDRILFQSQLGVSRQWSNSLSSKLSVSYQQQKNKDDSQYKASAWSTELSLVYTPSAWFW